MIGNCSIDTIKLVRLATLALSLDYQVSMVTKLIIVMYYQSKYISRAPENTKCTDELITGRSTKHVPATIVTLQ